jgi:hypothetical protein
MPYDPQTGRRIYALDERLRDEQQYIARLERELEHFEWEAALTITERFRSTIIWTVISLILFVPSVLAQIFIATPEDGYWLAIVVTAISLFFAVVSIFEKVGDHRGDSAHKVEYQKREIDMHQKRRDTLEAELIDEQTRATAKSVAKALKKKTDPEPTELLEVIVATASRDTAATESDALLWAVVAENPDDEDAWQAIADRNGWSADLMVKIKNVRTSSRAPLPAAAGAPAIAGWAG